MRNVSNAVDDKNSFWLMYDLTYSPNSIAYATVTTGLRWRVENGVNAVRVAVHNEVSGFIHSGFIHGKQ